MDKSNLLRQIQKYDFVIYELTLYLDTHPDCQEALNCYHKYVEMRKATVEEYNRVCGPLNMNQVKDYNRWTWVHEPWPWERSSN